MERFIVQQNIALIRRLLQSAQDECHRQVLLDFIAEEEAKLAYLTERRHIMDGPSPIARECPFR